MMDGVVQYKHPPVAGGGWVAMILAAIVLLACALWAGCDVWLGYGRRSPEYVGTMLAFRSGFVVLGLLLGLAVLRIGSRFRFLLYRYALRDHVLLVYDPLLRRSVSVDLLDVRLVRTFYSPITPAHMGHEVVNQDGSGMQFAADLPICHDIIQQCTNARVEAMQNPWGLRV